MIKYDVPMADYLAMDALSSGVAFKAINLSPAHALHYKTTERNHKDADRGQIIHQLLLEGHEENLVPIDAEDWRTKAAKEARDAAYAENKFPILAKEVEGIRESVKRALAFIETTELKGIFGNGHAETTVEWDEDGMLCKARPDYLKLDRDGTGWHISVKTTSASADPLTWSRRQMATGYDFSMAFYDRGLRANGMNVEHRFLVIEQTAPFGVAVFALAPAKAALADADVERAIRLWHRCLETNSFPGYSNRTHWVEPRPFEIADAEERAMMESLYQN